MSSHQTAISRKKVSAPMRYLEEKELINNALKPFQLDYGCGYGFDADHFEMDKYDPYYFPHTLILDREMHWNTITCHYVLNVLKNKTEARKTLKKIQGLLKLSGFAYITVRRDSFKSGKTTKGYQYKVTLDLPTVYKRSGGFEIYRLDAFTDIDKINILFE